MKLQSFLKILLLSSVLVGQVTLSKEQVRNISNKIDSLQTLDSLNLYIISDYKNKVKTDSLVIVELESQIKTQEEITELVDAIKQNSNKVHEAADVLYHLMVLLEANGIKIEDVMNELKKRQKK